MSLGEAMLTILGLAAISLLTRGFFVLPERDIPIPPWLREALRFAPLAALVAIAVPQVLLTPDGHWIGTWRDPELGATLAGTAWYLWRRTLLGTIVTGTAALLWLRLGLGW